MLSSDIYPTLEILLNQLLNKTEKNWGYLQIRKRGELYVISILGKGEDVLRFQSNETTNSYRLFWYKRPTPSVFVRSKTIKPEPHKRQLRGPSKTYQVHWQTEVNSLESSINRCFADLVKTKIAIAFGVEGAAFVSLVKD
ncbi:MAG: hypothetical protein ACFBSC_06685 [Microcoleaceae cyanobacterium]